MGRAASHITLECALQTHPNITIIGEEVSSIYYFCSFPIACVLWLHVPRMSIATVYSDFMFAIINNLFTKILL